MHRRVVDSWCAPRRSPATESMCALSQAYRHSDSLVAKEPDGGASSTRAEESVRLGGHSILNTGAHESVTVGVHCAPRLSFATEPVCAL